MAQKNPQPNSKMEYRLRAGKRQGLRGRMRVELRVKGPIGRRPQRSTRWGLHSTNQWGGKGKRLIQTNQWGLKDRGIDREQSGKRDRAKEGLTSNVTDGEHLGTRGRYQGRLTT